MVARLERYVAGYEAELANVVAEETYRQTVSQSARESQTRTLRSDYALTPAADRNVWVGYRDTFEVDGLPVRDREARLQRLLAGGAFAQAQRITEQNARFNLGSDLLPRTINVPTFALELLQPRYRDRFSRRRKGADSIDGRTGWLVEFRERDRPTIVRTPEGRDQPSRLLVLVDASNGQVLRTTVTWERVDGAVTVIYGSVPAISVLVPVRMSERYTTRNQAQIEGEAEYSNYRQFQTSGRVISP